MFDMLKKLLLLLVLSSGSAAAEPVILILGDSLSAAYGIAVEAGWVQLLEDRLNAEGFPHKVVNASISGDTTRNALARLPEALERHQPAIVIVEIGGNDGLRGLSLSAMRENLQKIIALCQQSGAKVLLLGIQIPPNYGPVYSETFATVYKELATAHQLLLAPFLTAVGDRPELMQADGIHPNEQGQPALLANVYPQLQKLLDQDLRKTVVE